MNACAVNMDNYPSEIEDSVSFCEAPSDNNMRCTIFMLFRLTSLLHLQLKNLGNVQQSNVILSIARIRTPIPQLTSFANPLRSPQPLMVFLSSEKYRLLKLFSSQQVDYAAESVQRILGPASQKKTHGPSREISEKTKARLRAKSNSN